MKKKHLIAVVVTIIMLFSITMYVMTMDDSDPNMPKEMIESQ